MLNLNLILKYIHIMFNVEKKSLWLVVSETSDFKLHVSEREDK